MIDIKYGEVRMKMSEKTKMVGFKYEGHASRIQRMESSRLGRVEFQKIVSDVNKKGRKIFQESRLMSLK